MAVSQKQIAEKLGVSIALVSRVLSGKAEEIGIAPETIARVTETAAEMGYVPSAAALAMKGKATRTIGVVVYDFKDPFFGAIIEQLQVQAHEHNYSLVLTGFINRIPQEQDLQPLYKHAIDGLIVIGTDLDARWLKHFSHIPTARIGHGKEKEKSVRISVDEKAAAGLLFDHLKKRGRRRPIYLCADLPAHQLRYNIFRAAAESKGLKLDIKQSSERSAFAAGSNAAEWVIRAGLETDTLICATDQIAIGALNALHQADISVPGQMAVTGFDGIEAGRQFIPAVTTIRQPISQIVEKAFRAVKNPSELSSWITLPGELAAGQTS